MFEVKGNITIDIPALDHLVDYLKGKEPVKVFMTEAMVDAAAKEAVEAEKAEKKAEPKKSAKAEKKVTEMPKVEAPAQEPVKEETAAPDPVKEETAAPEPEVQEKKYAPDEVAAMAMRLRDKDKANSAKIKEHFPSLGIVSLGDIRKNGEACQKLAKILIDMGGAE